MTLSLRVVLGLLALLIARTSAAEVDERSMRVAGTTVRYKLVVPDGYDPAEEYPAVLVFGGGPQTMRTVEGTLERNFRAEAERRGYLVFAPAAPNDELFFQRGDRIFPEFLDKLLAEHRIAGGKFHVAGPSNGGIAALHVAAQHPEYFRRPPFPVTCGSRRKRNCRSSRTFACSSTSASTTSTAGTTG